jgi:hypothetical protein
VHIKGFALILNLKGDALVIFNADDEFNGFFGVAVMGMDHQVGTNFIYSKHQLTFIYIRDDKFIQRLVDKVTYALKLVLRARNLIIIIHW